MPRDSLASFVIVLASLVAGFLGGCLCGAVWISTKFDGFMKEQSLLSMEDFVRWQKKFRTSD